jgi:hypothetical protein
MALLHGMEQLMVPELMVRHYVKLKSMCHSHHLIITMY